MAGKEGGKLVIDHDRETRVVKWMDGCFKHK